MACIGAGLLVFVVLMLLLALGVWGPDAWGMDCRYPGVPHAQDGRWSGGLSAERAFLEEMVPHHADAVAMAGLALTRAEHPELRELAGTIIRDQTAEIEQMTAWYRSWFGTEIPAEDDRARSPAGWGRGMGMMHPSDLEALEAAGEFDREFIDQMVPHHQMGVMMARMVLSRTDRPELEGLARAIITTQTGEIEQMMDWYRTWYE